MGVGSDGQNTVPSVLSCPASWNFDSVPGLSPGSEEALGVLLTEATACGHVWGRRERPGVSLRPLTSRCGPWVPLDCASVCVGSCDGSGVADPIS